MASKSYILILLVVLVNYSSGQSNHFEAGEKGLDDVRLHYEIVQKSSSILQVVTEDVVFPKQNQNNCLRITYIKAYDQYVNGNGGYANITLAGIGYQYAVMHFKSQRGQGFNFIFEIWGR